ncbi:YtxH domain-containing protein [Moritella sp.]|uniref:YtxH domain-containing protein n=1 Tax=Moritella sp. TaxID=78556 RepID=UPI001E19A530|nr:YtxH domain-containing protein [Moritella sp.]MCJ8350689.1 YtxH domain-containing protein [Moritella sp.]NQZ41029.1 YtxH domain-containing protein [Moritella sp.]NQZ51185.1 YtxH domain-containing protein [Moritella sp.]
MNNKQPYSYAPYYGYPQGEVKQAPSYKQQNSKTHFAMGLAAGAAVAYLLSNKKFQQGVSSTGEKAWSAVRGEVEELKERLEDTQAELDYYRNLNKGEK